METQALNFARARFSTVISPMAITSRSRVLLTYNGNLTVAPGVNGQVLRSNGYPENFIVANPQFLSASMITNISSNNYHSLQAQATMRPTYGLSGQLTYTWSKNLGFVG